MKVSDDAKAICRSIDALTKEIKYLGVVIKENQKEKQRSAEGKDVSGCEE